MATQSLGKLRSRYRKARAHLFEAGGHQTFMLFPDAYTAALSAFLEEV